jgi:hypothetical protein
MANRARPSHQKRDRERARLERRKTKEAKRQENKARKSEGGGSNWMDDEIARIVPGPQPPIDPLAITDKE